MIVTQDTNEVLLSNVGATGEFRIRNSAKAFSILSSGLYSNKIKAIVRELSTNAIDSHAAIGKKNVPFEVHLPTYLEPWFSVRDFGTGLDDEQIVNIYTTYFESSKTESNDFVGALGLGSKSPFSYTENFTVTAIKSGIKRIYSAFINPMGVPSIVEMNKENTTEENGVEVKFSVTNRYDYFSFENEAREVFSWFENKPTITGSSEFKHKIIPYQEKNIVPGVHSLTGSGDSVAVMGNIAYPIGNIPNADVLFKDLVPLLSCGLVLEFAIGELDFAASREQLSYIPLTINSIRTKLEQLNANLAAHLAVKANAISNEWERALFLYKEHSSRLYKAAVIKYAADTKFKLFDSQAYSGQKVFLFDIPELKKRGLDIVGHRIRSNHRGYGIGQSNRYDKNIYIPTITIPVDSSVVIVLNDIKTGCLARAKYHYMLHGKSVDVYCVSHNDKDVLLREIEYDILMKELHNPPVIVKASELDKPAPKKKISNQGILKYTEKSEYSYYRHGTGYGWSVVNDAIDDNQTYYYVCLSNSTPVGENDEAINILDIRTLMNDCGIPAIKDIQIFGVRKSRIAEIKQLDNWVLLNDILKEEVAKISDANVESYIAAEFVDNSGSSVYTNTSIAARVGKKSDYSKYVTEIVAMPKATGNVSSLIRLCDMFGKTLHIDKIRGDMNKKRALVQAKYPLLNFIQLAKEVDIAEYIKLVDNQ